MPFEGYWQDIVYRKDTTGHIRHNEPELHHCIDNAKDGLVFKVDVTSLV